MTKKHRVAVVVLNYNSEEDLFRCVSDLKAQHNVKLKLIIVDNASKTETVQAIKTWSETDYPNAISSTTEEIFNDRKIPTSHEAEMYVIYNAMNGGYSAGNNIGIKLADKLSADAVMIANPDMRFPDPEYVSKLVETLFSNDSYCIAASKIVGLDGKDQNPLREASFFEEFFWPRILFPKIFKNTLYVLPYEKEKVATVPKVVGCCLLLHMDFLRNIDYLDEKTFLYSEEPILAAQVKEKKGEIAFVPFIEAVHAHKSNEKGNSSKRMLLMIKSRKYYLKKYSGYNNLQLIMLNISYSVLSLLHSLKIKFGKQI